MSKSLLEVAQSTKYPIEAFVFLKKGMDFTVDRLHGPLEPKEELAAARAAEAGHDPDPVIMNRHVTGQQLCHGLRDFAIDQYGLLARAVLARWNIHRSDDFGHIVYAMVNAELLRTTEGDRLEDFADVFEFEDAFTRALKLGE